MQPARPVETRLALLKVRLPQQAASARREAWVEEMLGQAGCRAAEYGRGQTVTAFGERFGRQVFQVDPCRLPAAHLGFRGDGGLEAQREITPEGLDHGIAGFDERRTLPA